MKKITLTILVVSSLLFSQQAYALVRDNTVPEGQTASAYYLSKAKEGVGMGIYSAVEGFSSASENFSLAASAFTDEVRDNVMLAAESAKKETIKRAIKTKEAMQRIYSAVQTDLLVALSNLTAQAGNQLAAISLSDIASSIFRNIEATLNALLGREITAVQETGVTGTDIPTPSTGVQIVVPQDTDIQSSVPTTIINNPVIERIIPSTGAATTGGQTERILSVGGISEETLNTRLEQLSNKLSAQMFSLSAVNSTMTAQNYVVTAQTNKIDQLNSTRINSPTIAGGSLTNATVDATSLSVSGATTLGTLTAGSTTLSTLAVTGSFSANNNLFTINGTTTVENQFTATRIPSLAHTFSSWSSGVSNSNVTDATLLINPASAAADTNLFGIAVGDSVKFLVDAEGDTFVRSLTSVGETVLSTTTASTFTVENSFNVGDAIGDTFNIYSGTINYLNLSTSTIPNNTVNAWSLATSTSVTPVFSIDTTSGGRIGIGTTTPGSIFSINNVANFVTSATSSIYGALQTQNLIPFGAYTNNLSTYDLGASGARWNALWAGTLNVGTSTFSIKSDSSSSLGIFTAAGGGGTQALTITPAGNVGIGTTSPGYKLDVNGDINFTGKLKEDGVEIFSGQITAFASTCPTGWTEYTAARGRYVVGTPSGGTIAGTDGTALTDLEDRAVGQHSHGVTDPGHAHSKNTFSTGNNVSYSYTDIIHGSDNSGALGSWSTNSSATGITIDNSGSVAGTNAPYIQLTYCQKTAGADLAEWVPASENISSATIVSVDPSNTQRLIASRNPYDQTMVGIISTKPGWLIGDETPGSVQMALAGRVPVRVTLKNGDINRGDPITSSTISGVGMKATAVGPIIGKAMEPLNEQSSVTECVDPATGKKEKCGIVTVLVNVSWNDPAADSNSYSTIVAQSQFVAEHMAVDSEQTTVGDIVNVKYNWQPDEVHPEIQVRRGEVYAAAQSDNLSGATTMIGVLGDGTNGEILQKIRRNGVLISQKSLVTDGVTEVNIAPTSAEIKQGDWLTASELRGKAKKSTELGPTIGKALEDWTPSSGRTKIKVFVQPGYDLSSLTATGGDLGIGITAPADILASSFASASATLRGLINDLGNIVVRTFNSTLYAVTGIFDKLFAKEVHTDTLCVGQTCVTEEQLKSLLASAASSVSSSTSTPSTPADTEPPVITLNGNNPATIDIGTTYGDLGALVTDNVSQNLGISASVDGGATTTPEQITLDTSTAATHSILYSATDQAGNTGTATRTVNVIDPNATTTAAI